MTSTHARPSSTAAAAASSKVVLMREDAWKVLAIVGVEGGILFGEALDEALAEPVLRVLQ